MLKGFYFCNRKKVIKIGTTAPLSRFIADLLCLFGDNYFNGRRKFF